MVTKVAATPSTPVFTRSPLWISIRGPKIHLRRNHWPSYGITTPAPPQNFCLRAPFRFETGYALHAKRSTRPLPPPFLAPPTSSFSEPLTAARLSVKGELIRGLNNGDDAVIVGENYLGVNDGVGAWATKPQGHAGLWSRLLLHFWALELEHRYDCNLTPDPIDFLQRAFEETKQAASSPNEWFGTTTSVTALLHCNRASDGTPTPLLYVTNIGDCKILVIRPSEEKILFGTKEQWHWFDCPFQLGTNSNDTPQKDAVLSEIPLEEDDIVLALSDGVLDNLWEQEVLTIILDSVKKWDEGRNEEKDLGWAPPAAFADQKMVYVARELLGAALTIAQDPYAESPFMERGIEEGLAIEGGKMDDISVVVGSCKKRES